MATQVERAKDLVGERVRFRSGVDAGRVVNVTPDGLLEIEGYSGQFAPHLFAIVVEDGTEEIRLPVGIQPACQRRRMGLAGHRSLRPRRHLYWPGERSPVRARGRARPAERGAPADQRRAEGGTLMATATPAPTRTIRILGSTRQLGICRSCRASITWAKTWPNLKAMPLHGNPISLSTENVDGDEIQTINSADTHFAQCPQARKWSKR